MGRFVTVPRLEINHIAQLAGADTMRVVYNREFDMGIEIEFDTEANADKFAAYLANEKAPFER